MLRFFDYRVGWNYNIIVKILQPPSYLSKSVLWNWGGRGLTMNFYYGNKVMSWREIFILRV